MKFKGIIAVLLAILAIASAAWAWQTGDPQAGGSPTWNRAQTQQLPPLGGQPGYGGTSPIPPVYQGRQYEPPNQAGYPRYPYPRYHNPYYDGAPTGNFASSAVDWLLSFPSNLLNHVSNYLDGTFFPQAPATSGQGAVRSPVPGSRAPLPPASGYNPNSTTRP